MSEDDDPFSSLEALLGGGDDDSNLAFTHRFRLVAITHTSPLRSPVSKLLQFFLLPYPCIYMPRSCGRGALSAAPSRVMASSPHAAHSFPEGRRPRPASFSAPSQRYPGHCASPLDQPRDYRAVRCPDRPYT